MSLASNLAGHELNQTENPLKIFEDQQKSEVILDENAFSSGFFLHQTEDFYLRAAQEASSQLLKKIFENFQLDLGKDLEKSVLGSSDLKFLNLERDKVRKVKNCKISIGGTELIKSDQVINEDPILTAPEGFNQVFRLKHIESQSQAVSNNEILNGEVNENSSGSSFSYLESTDYFTVKSKKIYETFKPYKEIFTNELLNDTKKNPESFSVFQEPRSEISASKRATLDILIVSERTRKQHFSAQIKRITELCLVQEKTTIKNFQLQVKKISKLYQMTEKTTKKSFLPLEKVICLPWTVCEVIIIKYFHIGSITRCEPWVAFETTIKTRYSLETKTRCLPLMVHVNVIEKSFLIKEKIRCEPCLIDEKTTTSHYSNYPKISCELLTLTVKTTKKRISLDKKYLNEPLIINKKTTKDFSSVLSKCQCEPWFFNEKSTRNYFQAMTKTKAEPWVFDKKTISKRFEEENKRVCQFRTVTQATENVQINDHLKTINELELVNQGKTTTGYSENSFIPCNEIELLSIEPAGKNTNQNIEIIQKSIQNKGKSSNTIKKPFPTLLNERNTEKSDEYLNLSINNNPKTSHRRFFSNSDPGNFQISEEDLKFSSIYSKSYDFSNFTSNNDSDSQFFREKSQSKGLKQETFIQESLNEKILKFTKNISKPFIQRLFSYNQKKDPGTQVKIFSSFVDIQPVHSIIIGNPEKNTEVQIKNVPNQCDSILHESLFESEFEFRSSSIISSNEPYLPDPVLETLKGSISDFVLMPASDVANQDMPDPIHLTETILDCEEVKSESEDDFELI